MTQPPRPLPHGRLRRWGTYLRLVAADGFAVGNALFGASAAYLNLAPTAAGLATAGLFAAGGALDALHIIAPRLTAYRRRHHPRLAAPGADGERAPRRLLLDRVAAVPGLGQAVLGMGAATMLGHALATGATQMAAGVALLAAGHATFAAASVAKALGKRRPPAAVGRDDGGKLRWRTVLRAAVRDPVALGAVLVGVATATLNAGSAPLAVAAAALCATGGIAQAMLKHRALARRAEAPSPHRTRRDILRTLAGGGAGYALQAVGLALAASAAQAPAFQGGLAGFAAAMTVFSAATAVKALRQSRSPSPAPVSARAAASPPPARESVHVRTPEATPTPAPAPVPAPGDAPGDAAWEDVLAVGGRRRFALTPRRPALARAPLLHHLGRDR